MNPSIIIQIDDDEINNFISESVFKSNIKNVTVKSYVNPVEALHFLKNEFIPNPVPAAIFLDINMPEMNGWEILDELNPYNHIIENYIWIFMVSSSIDSIDIFKSTRNPLIKDFLSKPISNQLVRHIFKL